MSTELNTTQTPEKKLTNQNWLRPHYDVRESKEAFSVRISLPGVNREGVDVSLDNDLLTVVGTRADAVPEGWQALRREIKQGDYRLSLRLNVPVNEDGIEAHVENGILDLSLPKTDEVKPRKIQVS